MSSNSNLQSETTQYLEVREDLAGKLPASMYPLPIRAGRLMLTPSAELTKCLYLADQVLLDPATTIPPRLYEAICKRASRDKSAVGAWWAEFSVSLDYFLRYATEKDDPKFFPKGIASLQENTRKKLLRAIYWGRKRDLVPMLVEDYAQALERCSLLCAYKHAGHYIEADAPRVFNKKDVLQVMCDPTKWVGQINYAHIKTQLLRDAMEQ